MSSRSLALPWLRPSDLAMAAIGVGWSVVVVLLAASWHPEREMFVPVLPWPTLLSQAALGATLLLRRKLPLAVATGTLLGSAVLVMMVLASEPELLVVSDTQLIAPAITPFTSYAAVLYSERRTRAWMLVLASTALIARPWALDIAVVITAAAFVALPALFGAYVAARRRLIATLTERAERAEAEQRLLAEAARADERVRLAEEVHGVVTQRMRQMLDLT